jgi:hypothetical protein
MLDVLMKVIMRFYINKLLGREMNVSKFIDLFLWNRFLLKAIQQVDENNEINSESSIAYLYTSISPPATIVNLEDYCRLFECRSQM